MRWKFKRTLVKLLRLNNTPPEIALGAAIGVFIAILPVYGLHTVMVIVAAILIKRANKIAILLGTNISLPLTLPFITWAGYEIGRLILKNRFPDLRWSEFKGITLKKALSLYQPLFLGSIVLGLICAAIVYFIALLVATRIKEKRKYDRGIQDQYP